ncbi:30S ribosomal protein S6e [Candidatus Woesearchaeota archaeon]|jgi:small subunit ribosomal protein S6e|nr:30S ribosomal protein S6e [Candidatus Woesearchaeota archaeon]MBT5740144.1 30S ribosomal protein S6e [Candidatus Woesearchaeota archaeon]
MADYKVVIGMKDGKTVQKEIKSPEADALHNKIIGDTVKGDEMGMPGYEFLVTGGSDKCGFPMRKGIQAPRKRVFIGKSVGFSGKDRNKKKRGGLHVRKTVCGERITKIIRQVNLKVTKAGSAPLDAPAAAEETPK